MKERLYLRIFGIVFMLFGVTAACGENPRNTGETGFNQRNDQPDQESRPFSIVLSSGGIKSAEVKSGYMAFYNSKKTYYLADTVVADFYTNEGEHSSRLTSMRATISEKTDLMYAEGNVIVRSDSGITLFSERLYWDNHVKKIYTDDYVTFIKNGDTLNGRGFESDRSLKNYKIHNATGVAYRKVGKRQ